MQIPQENQYITKLRELIFNYVGKYHIKVYLYGSRAKGTEHRRSDIDIALLPLEPLPNRFIENLREKIENSTIPYVVDLVDLSQTNATFRKKNNGREYRMERLRERFQVTKKAMASFDEILREPHSKIIRDAAIQRFEFTLEALWKLAQRYLMLQEGIEVGSPKAAIRACFQVGLLNEETTQLLLEATDDRNLTVHTYDEELAEKIYRHLFKYQSVFHSLYATLVERVP